MVLSLELPVSPPWAKFRDPPHSPAFFALESRHSGICWAHLGVCSFADSRRGAVAVADAGRGEAESALAFLALDLRF
jgi:hypothetical protein